MKYTKLERNWVMYDVGNSALVLLNTSVVPIYFNAINTGASSADLVVAWGSAQTIASLVIAMLMPILGALADYAGNKIKFFLGFFLTGLVLCLAQAIPMSAMAFLAVYVLCTIGLNSSMTFYDAMLPDITTDERMDAVSSSGYAWGYIGSCVPFIACLLLVLNSDKIGLSQMTALSFALVITAVWWMGVSVPILRSYQQKYFLTGEEEKKNILQQLGVSLRDIAKNKKVFFFLLAFFFYIDGVYTIIDMSTAYGSALGLGSTDMLLALLVTQFVAFPFAILFGKLSQKGMSEKLIMIAIAAYTGIAIFAYFMSASWQFWVLAIFVGMFQGGIQALSRSYFAKIIPAERSGEFFGFYDICGKGASVIGTTLMGLVSQMTGSVNNGVGVIAVFFVIGLILFVVSTRQEAANN